MFVRNSQITNQFEEKTMADQKVSVIKLTEDMRKKIAVDLGLSEQLHKVPDKITIIGIKSADIGHKGPLPAVMINT